MAKARILVVEDEGSVARYIQKRLESLGYAVPAIAFSGEEAIKEAAETRPDLVLMDIRLGGGMDGVAAAERIQARFDIPVVYLTAYADDETLRRAKISEPYGYILKPFEERELHVAVEIALHTHRMRRKLKKREQALGKLTSELKTNNEQLQREITERKQAQQALETLSQQLQEKVGELEAFSYGIAHDLRSPMLGIEGFSRELRTDVQNQKMERVQEDIRLIESGVRKMQQFLNRTLEYSRAGYQVKPTENVPFGEIVEEVITEFNGQMSSIGATVSLAETFPTVCVDRMRIRQVLTNLIQNSIKYRDKTVPLKIEIGHRLSESEVVFFVSDNGTGIDASEKEKLFTLFHRGAAEVEGSGIGLAIVKKIIEAHGGRIWVQQGQSRKGTTMCFTLPKQSGTNKGDNNGKD